MAWIEGTLDRAWLLGGTRQGELIVWSVKADRYAVHSTTTVCDAEITGLYPSPDGLLAVVSSGEIQIVRATDCKSNVVIHTAPDQIIPLHGSHVSQARWSGSKLAFCTPGQVDIFDAEEGVNQSVQLQDSGEEESCCFRPAACERIEKTYFPAR